MVVIPLLVHSVGDCMQNKKYFHAFPENGFGKMKIN